MLLVTMIRGFSVRRDSLVVTCNSGVCTSKARDEGAGEGVLRGVGTRTMGGVAMLNIIGDEV